MKVMNHVSPKTKKIAAGAAGTMAVANPLISLFLAGVGLALYFSLRTRRD